MKFTILLFTFLSLVLAGEKPKKEKYKPLLVGLGGAYADPYGYDGRTVGYYLERKLNRYLHGFNKWRFMNFAHRNEGKTATQEYFSEKFGKYNPDLVYLWTGPDDLNYVSCLHNTSTCDDHSTKADLTIQFINLMDVMKHAMVKAKGPVKPLQIFVINTPRVVSAMSRCDPANPDCPYTREQLHTVIRAGDVLRDWTLHLVGAWERYYFGNKIILKVIPMDEYSDGHEVGSGEPWMNGATVPFGAGGTAWHPNLRGIKAVADKIFEEYTNQHKAWGLEGHTRQDHGGRKKHGYPTPEEGQMKVIKELQDEIIANNNGTKAKQDSKSHEEKTETRVHR